MASDAIRNGIRVQRHRPRLLVRSKAAEVILTFGRGTYHCYSPQNARIQLDEIWAFCYAKQRNLVVKIKRKTPG
jgi:hypothetical protein